MAANFQSINFGVVVGWSFERTINDWCLLIAIYKMSYKDEVINTALNKAQLEHKKPLQHSAINNVLLRTIQQHTIHAYFIPYDRNG